MYEQAGEKEKRDAAVAHAALDRHLRGVRARDARQRHADRPRHRPLAHVPAAADAGRALQAPRRRLPRQRGLLLARRRVPVLDHVQDGHAHRAEGGDGAHLARAGEIRSHAVS
mgnify:CR=1 FL=1